MSVVTDGEDGNGLKLEKIGTIFDAMCTKVKICLCIIGGPKIMV